MNGEFKVRSFPRNGIARMEFFDVRKAGWPDD
jgi:hypothetical protein